ncbi:MULTISPECIES: hypothetical protein [unclassified Microcoleus]|uniref:hypothetical protein n=1 Tax=unclassified Microcoleus TaxID=2642155 RepID=UPI002FCF34EE
MKITASEIPLAGMAISEVMTENPIAISRGQAGNIFKVLGILRSSSRAANGKNPSFAPDRRTRQLAGRHHRRKHPSNPETERLAANAARNKKL